MSLSHGWTSHREISDKVHHLFCRAICFQPDRFVQLLSLIAVLFLLLYFLFSIDLEIYLVYCEFRGAKKTTDSNHFNEFSESLDFQFSNLE